MSIQLYHAAVVSKFYNVPKPTMSILAVGVHIPINIASVIRIADAVAAHKVYLNGASIDVFKKHRHQIEKMSRVRNQCVVLEEDCTNLLAAYGQRSCAIEITDSSVNIFDVSLPTGEMLLVVGSERYGLPEEVLSQCHIHAHVPMYGHNSSLNVGAALSVCAYTVAWKQKSI